MRRSVVGCALLSVTVISAAVFSASQVIGQEFAEAGTPVQVSIQVSLDPGEILWSAVVGNLTDSLEPALVLGTLLPGGHTAS